MKWFREFVNNIYLLSNEVQIEHQIFLAEDQTIELVLLAVFEVKLHGNFVENLNVSDVDVVFS